MMVVVSPHCDDAALGCGDLLLAHPGTLVVTVCAGRPPAGSPLASWDADAGFGPGDDVMAARRAEDAAALALLDARPRWLDFCDAQYRAPAPVAAVAGVLRPLLDRAGATTVLVPLGLFHDDHRLAHAAGRLAAAGRRLLAYEDALYRRYRGLLDARLAALRADGVAMRPTRLAPERPASARKRAAIACYRSQLRALHTPGRPGHEDALAPERVWELGPCAA
jgi:LmbE family N-acetylglucosaminyl deacetylase